MRNRLGSTPLTILALASALFLSACGGPTSEELIRQNVTEAFEEVDSSNEEMIEAATENSGGQFELLGIEPEQFMKTYLDGFSYEIAEITVDDKEDLATAAIDVEMKSLTDIIANFSAQFEDYIQSLDPRAIPSEEDIYKKGGELLMQAAEQAEPQKSEVLIDYNKNEDGEWEPEEDAEMAIMDAML